MSAGYLDHNAGVSPDFQARYTLRKFSRNGLKLLDCRGCDLDDKL